MTDASTIPDGIPNTSPVRQAPWWRTYCGDQHQPDLATTLDAGYNLGTCAGVTRQLVRDMDQAQYLAQTVGKYRPEGVPVGGHRVKHPVQPVVAKPGETKRVQGGQA